MPQKLFHGSSVFGLTELVPMHRTTPGELRKEDVPASIYATDNRLASVMFSFPWTSQEGIDIQHCDGTLKLLVPQQLASRIENPMVVYEVDGHSFTRIPEVSQLIGNFWSQVPASILDREEFPSVREAILRNGGLLEVTR